MNTSVTERYLSHDNLSTFVTNGLSYIAEFVTNGLSDITEFIQPSDIVSKSTDEDSVDLDTSVQQQRQMSVTISTMTGSTDTITSDIIQSDDGSYIIVADVIEQYISTKNDPSITNDTIHLYKLGDETELSSTDRVFYDDETKIPSLFAIISELTSTQYLQTFATLFATAIKNDKSIQQYLSDKSPSEQQTIIEEFVMNSSWVKIKFKNMCITNTDQYPKYTEMFKDRDEYYDLHRKQYYKQTEGSPYSEQSEIREKYAKSIKLQEQAKEKMDLDSEWFRMLKDNQDFTFDFIKGDHFVKFPSDESVDKCDIGFNIQIQTSNKYKSPLGRCIDINI